MVTNVELTDEQIADLKELTNQADVAEAVRTAMQGYLRYARRIRLKELSGRVEMLNNWRTLEETELNAGDSDGESGTD